MGISEYISNKSMNLIKNSLDKTDTELEQIQYGIDSLLANIIKLIILFATAYFLGITKYTFIAVISFGAIRAFAAGIHASSSLQCIITNYIIFFGNVYLSLFLKLNKIHITLIFVLSLCLVILYAPADTAAKPLVSKKARKKLKTLSILSVIFLYVLSMSLKNNIYSNLVALSVLIESILITPLIYKIFKSEYRNYEKYK